MTYAIKNTKNGKFFGGFSGLNVIWSDVAGATRYTNKLHASTQALCLRSQGETAQAKPVAG